MRLLTIVLFVGVMVGTATAQSGPPKSGDIPPADQVKFKNLQLALAGQTIRVMQLQAEIARVEAERKAVIADLSAWIGEQAKALGIDLEKYTLNPDTMQFVPKPAPKPPDK